MFHSPPILSVDIHKDICFLWVDTWDFWIEKNGIVVVFFLHLVCQILTEKKSDFLYLCTLVRLTYQSAEEHVDLTHDVIIERQLWNQLQV